VCVYVFVCHTNRGTGKLHVSCVVYMFMYVCLCTRASYVCEKGVSSCVCVCVRAHTHTCVI